MESGNTAANLKLLGWRTLEERRIDNKLVTLNNGFLGKIGGGPVFTREHSKIDAHRHSFFPCTALNESAKELSKIYLVELKNCLTYID